MEGRDVQPPEDEAALAADVDLSERFLEWQFRRLIPLTHEQYLDEPADSVEWILEIERVAAEAKGS